MFVHPTFWFQPICVRSRSGSQFDLILGTISFSESNIYQSELSTALGSGEFDGDLVLVRPCPSTWTGWTHCESWSDIKDVFFYLYLFNIVGLFFNLSVSILEDSVAIFVFRESSQTCQPRPPCLWLFRWDLGIC
jgi:hypothetical protein